MTTIRLDTVDRYLLDQVQRNNRRPLRTLAQLAGISAPTCLRRLRRLRVAGVIQKQVAVLEPSKAGFHVQAFIEVSLIDPSGVRVTSFARRMQRCAEVQTCAELAGHVDFMLSVVAHDMNSFRDFVRRHLAEAADVRKYRTLLVLHAFKSTLSLPIKIA